MIADSGLSTHAALLLLTIATRAAAERDREHLTLLVCEEATAVFGAEWTALAHVDEDGALVATLGGAGTPEAKQLADAVRVAASGLPSATSIVRIPAAVRDDIVLDALVIDPDRADVGVLVVAHHEATAPESEQVAPFLETLVEIFGGALERIRIDGEIAANEQRLASAQALANLGSYDWHIPSDTNTWSDELYRIYGHKPGAFNASYERFLAMIHPEDRERIVGVHTQAMQDFQPYRMEERIIRPDGEIRILDSSGMVVLDEQGRPERMVGICLDVTEQRRAAVALHHSEERFRTLIESAPDAVVLFDADGKILQANRETERLFGWSADELRDVAVDILMPEIRLPLDSNADVIGHHRNGSTIIVGVRLAEVQTADGLATAAFVRDLTERRRAAAATERLRQVEEHRRQALEINDNVIQGLTTVLGSLEMGWATEALTAARTTLAAASAMISELLDVAAEDLRPGDLLRDRGTPAHLTSLPSVEAAAQTSGAPQLSVVLADDSADLRALYRLMLARHGISVVAEAADGEEALAMALAHEADVLLVDLAMPRMDGMQVTTALKAQRPDIKVVMLSGFEEGRVGELARAAGVDRYVSKGIDGDALAEVLFAIGAPGKSVAPPRATEEAEPIDPAEELLHELRTPLTVISGMVATLRNHMDDTSREDVREMLEAITRNADHLEALVSAHGDMRRVDSGRLLLSKEPQDLVALVEETIADLHGLLRGHQLRLDVADPLITLVDPLRIRQVLTNLLSNAVKFSPNGSVIHVSVREEDAQVAVRVTNSGPGIDPADRPRIFRPFERLNPGVKGLGLGLYIASAIADAHGGSLELAADEKTTFVLRIPLEPSAVERV